MGVPFLEYMDDENGIYICKGCGACLTNPKMLVSKQFRGATGTAYLFDKVVNIKLGEMASRGMTTGQHIVRDVNCSICNAGVGWFYEMAFNIEQRYKEGQYILELEYISLIASVKDGARQFSRTGSTSTNMGESSSTYSFDDEKEDITV